jgi:uncharacterized protein YndB with AHSA1/START domain
VPEPPSATRTLEHEVRIEAPPEAVFAYFTDPAKFVRWMGNGATLDPRPGGTCRVNIRRAFGEIAIVGEFVEVVPYSRVVFTWGWEGEGGLFGVPPGSSRVEVSLVPEGDATRVRVVHGELPERPVEEAGWPHYLTRLTVAAAGGDPGPDEFVPPGISPPGAPGRAA